MPRARALPSIERISTWTCRGTLKPGSRGRVGEDVLVLVVERLDLAGRGLGDLGEELLDRDLDDLGADPLVLVAVRAEDVVGGDDRRSPAERRTLTSRTWLAMSARSCSSLTSLLNRLYSSAEELAVHPAAGDLA